MNVLRYGKSGRDLAVPEWAYTFGAHVIYVSLEEALSCDVLLET